LTKEQYKNIDTKSLVTEISALKRQLKDQESVFQYIMEGTLAGYWDWRVQENYEYLSPTFKSMFGYADHEMENTPESWQKIIFEEDLPIVFSAFEEHVKSKGHIPFTSESRYHHKDGRTVWVFCRGKVIEWAEDGSPLRVVGSHVDITPFKLSEEKQLEYSRILESKNRDLKEFAYIVSHDLKEPLNTIANFSNLVKDKYQEILDEKGKKFLGYISDSTERMSTLINSLLQYSNIGHEETESTLDCNAIIDNVMDDLTLRISDTNAEFTIKKLPEIQGFETDIRQLFQNLISNALKFIPDSTIPNIKINANDSGDFFKFSITDNGIGITEEYYDRIFSIFQRLHSKADFEGTGIGLANCKKIVENHGGDIWVESKVGEGSTFHFTIKK
jgi:PAS domain S-box-containing protein